MSDSMKQIAMRIEDLRDSSDYTVEQMAEKLNISVADSSSHGQCPAPRSHE